MTAFIIYDSFALACRANVLLQNVAENVSGSFVWNVLPWRTQILRFNPTGQMALREARDAHLLVFAWEDQRPLHSWMANWLESWAACRTIPEAAIAVVREGNQHTEALPELSRFAARHGIGMILSERNIPEFRISAPVLISKLMDHGSPLIA
ncbi:MAG TPA: hypothetical protein VF988_01280 [Verrucomicrobiae bacterium]